MMKVFKGIQAVRIAFLFVLKVANIRCFIQIKCSEQKSRFNKICYNGVISENNSNVLHHLLVESPLTRHNYKSAAFPKFAEQRVVIAINN